MLFRSVKIEIGGRKLRSMTRLAFSELELELLGVDRLEVKVAHWLELVLVRTAFAILFKTVHFGQFI